MNKDKIKSLLEQVRELEQSPENQRRKDKWKRLPYTANNFWRGLPKNDRSWKQGIIPVAIDPQNEFWSKYFNFSLKDYYIDKDTFLESYLKVTIERFRLFDDDVFITKRIPIWMSNAFEGSLFGIKVNYFNDKDPWMDHEILIKDHKDLNKIESPDFEKSGMMPYAIRMYEEVKEIVDDDFDVMFPEWHRGPFGIAMYLRGFENILMDIMLEPEFVHKLMRFITEANMKWYADMANYTGRRVNKVNLYNDDINCPSLSPGMYREFVLPYETELSNFHGGIHYWHSCGNCTKLIGEIANIPSLDMIHVGPWTEVKEAGEVFKDKAPLEICMNPQADILEASEEQMIKRVQNVINDCEISDTGGFTLRINGLAPQSTIEHALGKARIWSMVVKNIIEKKFGA